MFESKRMKAEFEPPRVGQSETRKPLLWIKRDGDEVFLVNASSEALTFVRASSGGFVSSDDGAHATKGDWAPEYQNVAPGEAVKVEEYDGYYDLDYVLQVQLQVRSPGLGEMDLLSTPAKGGVKTQVVLWSAPES